MRIPIVPIVVAVFAASASTLAAGADVTNDVEGSFSPYKEATGIGELPPVFSKGNWQRAEGLLPVELLDKIKSGDLEIRIQETTDLPPSAAYIEATRRNADQVRLGQDGNLVGYIAGRPFPRIDPADPQAGLKLAWNARYRETADSAQAWGLFRFIGASGQDVRHIEFYYAIAYGMHRGDPKANLWEGSGILFKELFQCLAPDDVKNVMQLKFRYDDDRASDLNFAYVREMHKVRQINVDPREPAMSSEILNEDFYGFWGYLHEHDWRLLGRATLLAPVGVKAAKPTYSAGRGYPADPWERRQMFVVEATPRVPNHPYGKRVLYIDEQMGVPLYVLAYDPQGRHYKTLFTLYGNPAFSPGNEQVRAPLWLGTAAVNHASHEASVTAMNRVVVENRVQEDRFTVGQLAQLAR
jgi:Protein of unknown function (DUF1329)